MGLVDRLRRAEEQGRDAARRSYEKAKDTWEDTERRIRRRMRVVPRPGAWRRVDESASGKLVPPPARADEANHEGKKNRKAA